MNRKLGIVLGIVGLLLVAAAPARADDTSRWWVVPGGQVTWPSKALDLDRRALGPGGILGARLAPNWAVEGRLHYTQLDAAKGIVGPGSDWLRVEANATYFLEPGARWSPYITGGIGTVDFSDALDGTEFVWNAGVGFLYHFNPTVSLRVDGRHLGFRHPVLADDDWLANHEIFAGLSFGFGGAKPVRRAEPAPARDGDQDDDGVPDSRDRCPNTPKGCHVDENGCELDGDKDGVCDGKDRCPDTPRGDKVDRNGCTITEREKELIETGRIRLENVYFDTAKSTIKRESHDVLNEVAGILNKYDDLKIEIGGHTDARGSEAYNERLSDDRAHAVLEYLMTKHDFSRARFSAKGYGESEPVAPNDTAANMAKNRRVEFKVLNPEALQR